LPAKGLEDALEAWRSYLAFLDRETHPGFAWMLPSGKEDYLRGFKAGAQLAFALREQSPGSESIAATLVDRHELKELEGQDQRYQMGFMAALEQASILELQRPVHSPGTLKLRPAELCLPEAPAFPPDSGLLDAEDSRPSPADTPSVKALKGQRLAFARAKHLRLCPQWGSYLGARQQAYEAGYRDGVRHWEWDSHGHMSPRIGQEMLRAAFEGKPLPYHLGFMAGMEARTAFLAQAKGLIVRVQTPASAGSALPFEVEFLGFVPESLPLPPAAEMKDRTLLEAVGLRRIEACVVPFDGRDLEIVRRALTEARCLGREKDIPLSLTPGTQGYLRCYDGRTLPFRVHGPWLFAGGWCFGPRPEK